MLSLYHFFVRMGCGFLLCFIIHAQVIAQTAPPPSRVTPERLTPEVPPYNDTITLTSPPPVAAPENASDLWVTIQSVTITGGLPELSEQVSEKTKSVEGRRVSIKELYALAGDIEALYARSGFVLTRTTVPPQSIVDGGSFNIVIVEGFIEEIDTSSVPHAQRRVLERRVQSLKGLKGLTLAQIERRLLLASDIPGLHLNSALARGDQVGGTKLVISGAWRPVSVRVSFDNRISGDFGDGQYILNTSLNSVLGQGELIYSSLITNSDFNTVFRSNPRRRIVGVGAVIPLGSGGIRLNPEFTRADTTPRITDPNELATRGFFERYSLRLSYPIIKTRPQTWTVSGSFEAINEHQTASLFGLRLNDDRLRLFTLETDWAQRITTNIRTFTQISFSQGIEGFGARNLSDIEEGGVPFSRFESRPDFSKISFSSEIFYGAEQYGANLTLRGQKSLTGALPSSAQFGLDGDTALSTFTTGSFNVDNGITLRGELTKSFSFPIHALGFIATPYAFGALAAGNLESPTFLEQRTVRGAAFGGGLRSNIEYSRLGTGLQFNIEGGRGISNIPNRSVNRVVVSVGLYY